MRALSLISGISFQTNTGVDKNITLLDATILIPSICAIMALVVVAGIAITVQKHKRY